jgi:hypothetical protein
MYDVITYLECPKKANEKPVHRKNKKKAKFPVALYFTEVKLNVYIRKYSKTK